MFNLFSRNYNKVLLNTKTNQTLSTKNFKIMKYDLLLAELIVERSQNRIEVSQITENQESNKGWLERFFEFLTPNDIKIATR